MQTLAKLTDLVKDKNVTKLGKLKDLGKKNLRFSQDLVDTGKILEVCNLKY